LFRLIQRVGAVPEADMRRTFNLGIGMILVVGKPDAGAVLRALARKKERPTVIGEVA
jgi:phosphoribosylformylglycinamidine cyclo-ligase